MKCKLLAAAAVVFSAACGGDGEPKTAPATTAASGQPAAPVTTTTAKPQESAGAYMKRLFDFISKGQFDREWETLHPAQQAFVTKDKFVQCGSQSGLNVLRADVVEEYPSKVGVPGTDLKDQDSTAVSVKVTARIAGQTRTETVTFHAFPLNGEWRWTLSDPEPYKQGRCP